MPEISAKDVMALRAATGLGMMDCKKALAETEGDVEAAQEWLRKKLKGKMDTRVDRAAGEGRIAVLIDDRGRSAAIVEVRAETDFTARNDTFLKMVDGVAKIVLAQPAGDVPVNDQITALVDEIRISTGENVSYARGHKLSGEGSTMFGSYIHHDGKTGVLLQGEGSISQDLLRDIGMHVTAAVPRPLGVTKEDVPSDVVEKERKFAMEQAIESGKNEEIAQKMVQGKIRKLYEELALLEQPFVKDPDKRVRELLPKDATLTAFLRWQVGE